MLAPDVKQYALSATLTARKARSARFLREEFGASQMYSTGRRICYGELGSRSCYRCFQETAWRQEGSDNFVISGSDEGASLRRALSTLCRKKKLEFIDGSSP